MLEVKNLDILINTRLLINNLSFVVNNGDKLAIIGEEGNGKSTLLKALIGELSYAEVAGLINYKNYNLGYLPQMLSEEELEKTVETFLFSSNEDFFQKSSLYYQKLAELNLKDVLNQKLKTLSGGEKIKFGILKLLLEQKDILLLDEPTNDIDLETLKWLESFIANISLPVIFVSHDEMFLSKTANMILHIEQIKKKMESRYTFEKISYDEYIEKRLRSINHQNQMAISEQKKYNKKENKLKQIMNKVHYEQNTISRSDPHGGQLLKKKMKSLKSQEKRLENVELTQKVQLEDTIFFDFPEVTLPKGKKIIDLNLPELKVFDKVLARNIKLNVYGNEHIVIVGKNGIGKTTLINEIINALNDSINIKYSYMPQVYDDVLGNYETPIDFLAIEKSKENITMIRSYLGNMNFTRDEMINNINLLSGGSKAKLFLLKMVLDGNELLILDEPTRNVSPLSNPVIRKRLSDYQGAIISVSHDRKYIEEVADKVYLLTNEGLQLINKKDIL